MSVPVILVSQVIHYPSYAHRNNLYLRQRVVCSLQSTKQIRDHHERNQLWAIKYQNFRRSLTRREFRKSVHLLRVSREGSAF